MHLPVLLVLCRNANVTNHQQIFSVLLVSCFRKIKRPGENSRMFHEDNVLHIFPTKVHPILNKYGFECYGIFYR